MEFLPRLLLGALVLVPEALQALELHYRRRLVQPVVLQLGLVQVLDYLDPYCIFLFMLI